MKIIDSAEHKEILCEILQNIHDFCVENDIKYSMAGGTLIGAIRHKGFIPWDDDIDLYLTRENYEKLVKCYNDPKGIYKLHDLKNDPEYCYPFAKIEDTRTYIDENVAGPKMGIAIDLFPVDYLKDNYEDSVSLVKKILRFRILYFGKMVKPNPTNSFVKRMGIRMIHFITYPLSLRAMAKWYNEKCQKIGGKKRHEYAAAVVWGYGVKEIMKSTVLDDYILVPFEGRFFYSFKDYHSYLSGVFGDYMQLPPEDKRHSPHTLNGVYWK